MYHRFCVDKILQKSWQNLVKLGIISQFERRNYENSSAFRMPRQEFLFYLNLLTLCGFLHNRRMYYNDFTTFEKCSDMMINLKIQVIYVGD